MSPLLTRREFLQAGGALLVTFATPALAQRLPDGDRALGKTLDTTDVDGFIAINADGSVTVPQALRPFMGGVEVLKPVHD